LNTDSSYQHQPCAIWI